MIKIQFSILADVSDVELLERIMEKLNLRGMRGRVTLAKRDEWPSHRRELRVDVMPRAGQESHMAKKLRQLEQDGKSLVNAVVIIAEVGK